MKLQSRTRREILQDLSKIQDSVLPGVDLQPPFTWRTECALRDFLNLCNHLDEHARKAILDQVEAALAHPVLDSLRSREERLWQKRTELYESFKKSLGAPKNPGPLWTYLQQVYEAADVWIDTDDPSLLQRIKELEKRGQQPAANELRKRASEVHFRSDIVRLVSPMPEDPDRPTAMIVLGFDWPLVELCFEEEEAWEAVRRHLDRLRRSWNMRRNRRRARTLGCVRWSADEAMKAIEAALPTLIPTRAELRGWYRSLGFDKRRISAPHKAWTILSCRLSDYLQAVSRLPNARNYSPRTAAAQVLRLAYPTLKTPTSAELRARSYR